MKTIVLALLFCTADYTHCSDEAKGVAWLAKRVVWALLQDSELRENICDAWKTFHENNDISLQVAPGYGSCITVTPKKPEDDVLEERSTVLMEVNQIWNNLFTQDEKSKL